MHFHFYYNSKSESAAKILLFISIFLTRIEENSSFMNNIYIYIYIYMYINVQMSSMAYNTTTDEIGRIHIQRLVSKEISIQCSSTS